MKFRRSSAVWVLVMAWALYATAAEDAAKSPLDGTWLWNFTMPDGAHVTPRVKFRMKDGELTGTSRFRPGAEAPLTNIVFQNGQVSFDVVREYFGERVVTHYSGKLEGTEIKGKITSNSGEKQIYDWDAK